MVVEPVDIKGINVSVNRWSVVRRVGYLGVASILEFSGADNGLIKNFGSYLRPRRAPVD